MDKGMYKELVETFPLRTDLANHEIRELLHTIDSPGFKHIIGLMTGQRQGFYTMLASMPLASREEAHRAAVIQGRARAVADLHTNIVELLPAPTNAPE